MWQAAFIFAGLSLDSFIVMMQKGAQMRTLNGSKLLRYTLLYAAVTGGMFLLGYGGGHLIEKLLPGSARINYTIAALIVFFVGVFQITKSFMKNVFVEKADDSFDYKQLFRQALYTSIDVFFVGAAFRFASYPIGWTILTAFLISFAAVFVAFLIGYNLGAGYQKQVGVIGGILMVFFSIYMIAVYVLG